MSAPKVTVEPPDLSRHAEPTRSILLALWECNLALNNSIESQARAVLTTGCMIPTAVSLAASVAIFVLADFGWGWRLLLSLVCFPVAFYFGLRTANNRSEARILEEMKKAVESKGVVWDTARVADAIRAQPDALAHGFDDAGFLFRFTRAVGIPIDESRPWMQALLPQPEEALDEAELDELPENTALLIPLPDVESNIGNALSNWDRNVPPPRLATPERIARIQRLTDGSYPEGTLPDDTDAQDAPTFQLTTRGIYRPGKPAIDALLYRAAPKAAGTARDIAEQAACVVRHFAHRTLSPQVFLHPLFAESDPESEELSVPMPEALAIYRGTENLLIEMVAALGDGETVSDDAFDARLLEIVRGE